MVIASNAAGTTFTDGLYWRIGACIVGAIFVVSYLYWYCKKLKEPKASYAYEDKTEFEKQWSVMDQNSSSTFTLRKKSYLPYSYCHSLSWFGA